jgi:hypothetical protein
VLSAVPKGTPAGEGGQATTILLARADQPPILALYWEPKTGALSRLSDVDDPQVRTLMKLLLDTAGQEALDANITRVLTELVSLRARP